MVGQSAISLRAIDINAMRKGPQLNELQRESLIAPVTEEEIIKSFKSIDDRTTSGYDGYSACFYKSAWEIIKDDLKKDVREFFDREILYKAINSSIVTFILKVSDASRIKDFRPISCCTIVYKVISKIMANRLDKVIGHVVNSSQTTFIPGKCVQDHILLGYKLIRGYNRNRGPPRCMIQMDL